MANKVSAVAAAVALPLATETAIVTVAPQAPGNQVSAGNVEISAEVTVTGAASATNNTLKLRRGAGIAGADIMPTDVVMSVDGGATDKTTRFTVQETAANFNAVNGVYTLTGTAAGAAQTARLATLSVTPLQAGV